MKKLKFNFENIKRFISEDYKLAEYIIKLDDKMEVYAKI